MTEDVIKTISKFLSHGGKVIYSKPKKRKVK